MAEYATYIYQVIDKFSPVLAKINRANDRFMSGMRKAQGGLKSFGEKAGRMQNALAGVGAGAGLALVSKRAMDFESVMTDVDKVVNFTAENTLGKFKENILKTSVELGKLPKNLAEIAVAGGKLGVPIEDMDNFIGVVARTSVAFDMLESEAGEQLGSIQAKMGLTVDETGNLMDAVNFLADNTSAAGNRMINIIARTTGELKGIEMPANFIAGWASFADMMETSPELAASGLNMMVRKLQTMPGMTEMLVTKPHETISQFLKQISKLDKISRIKFIEKEFGPEAGRFVKKAVINMEKFDKTMALVSDKTKFTGSMMIELQKKLNTSGTAWSRIKAIIDVVAITIGDVLTPYIKAAAPHIVKIGFAFREWAKAHPKIVKIGLAIAAITAVAAPLIVVLGMMSAAIGAISLPMIAVAAGVAAVVGGLYLLYKGISYVIQNWDKMVAAMKDFGDWWVDKFTFDFMVDGIDKVVAKIKPMIDWFYKLDKVLGFETEKPKAPITEKELADKIARVRAMRREMGIGSKGAAAKETGVAAANVAATKASLNGSIVVSAKQGSAIESAGMKTSVPGNLGFNLMGATP